MSEHTTHIQNVKRLERPRDGRKVAGVAEGLGRYFDITPTVFRLAFVVLTLLGGAGILVYIAAALVMPAEGEEFSMAERTLRERSDHPYRLVGLALVAIAILAVITQAGTWLSASTAWVLAAIGLLLLLFRNKRRPRGLVVALVTLLAVVVAAIAVAAAAAFAVFNVSLGDGVGDRTYTPASVAQVRPEYKLGIGNLKIDLSAVRPVQPLHVKARLAIGKLRIIVPHDASVSVSAHVKAGSISALGRTGDGTSVQVTAGRGHTLFVTARVGAGRIEVVRAG